ncbi:hypothetical protein, partial [Actinoplanes nipponensis]|uniref:hypothetical protein n=1 Tax=Actinoplanes nipponensis TaxID=135950 RepID=UPI0031F05C3C
MESTTTSTVDASGQIVIRTETKGPDGAITGHVTIVDPNGDVVPGRADQRPTRPATTATETTATAVATT